MLFCYFEGTPYTSDFKLLLLDMLLSMMTAVSGGHRILMKNVLPYTMYEDCS